ncbi:2-aminoethylphosphonate--pyruvate transaminase [Azospirillum sp. YIM B02556]|uniref:2-aminoethylphosphonate--pyruvate transaminase n=1 Tax=Azospirillum endophyticum TaxID=2800326 RepID=A0ABS1EZP8_9PROT|nr:2-aminoethylphosphonate--pyruvate transaminase [Azospirillum endophyticum]MBK1836567.1 2-aminoethylphosphonate--pyruvate transaminase [Azospirillum endophyticum]
MSDTVPYLLTPGPLTTSATVKQAMLRDWGSRDGRFIALNAAIRDRLVRLAGGSADSHVAVPVQGSGTFAVEAMIGTLVPRAGRLLVLVNGAYGTRMVRIAKVAGRSVTALETAEDLPVSPTALAEALDADPAITHVAVVHCETTSGILNPIEAVAEVTRSRGRSLLVDAMSAFGALPFDMAALGAVAVAASSNKCLEGVPGMGFVIARRDALEAAKGNAHSLSLDLHDQWRGFEANAQWRFTPPTHVVAAFAQALDEHEAEGGVGGRGARYRANAAILIDGMRALGFETLLPDHLQAPIIVTFRMPADPVFVFADFYDRLRERGFVIYPGKLTVSDSFRIGCIGRLGAAEMTAAIAAIRNTLSEMGVASGAP